MQASEGERAASCTSAACTSAISYIHRSEGPRGREKGRVSPLLHPDEILAGSLEISSSLLYYTRTGRGEGVRGQSSRALTALGYLRRDAAGLLPAKARSCRVDVLHLNPFRRARSRAVTALC